MASETRPLVVLQLDWQGDLRFAGRSGETGMALDGDGRAAVSPVQALAFALAACMASDVVHILRKGRLDLGALQARLTGERAPEDPRRFLKIALQFIVSGEVPADKVERAIALSLEKYCSVWHSLRQDIELTTSFEVQG